MNILIIGSGAREHAIAESLSRSPQLPHLFCCGNSFNPGIISLSNDFWVGDINHIPAVLTAAKNWAIDLAIIGPEAPLACGLADALWDSNIPTVGPKKNLAQIESSKAFARDLMEKYNIPGLPRYQKFSGDLKGVEAFLHELGDGNYVIKANGLMGGKGVKVAGDHLHSFTEALSFCTEILASGQSFIIEEKLIGQEFSLMCFCDGERVIPMPLVQDHKRAYENDEGPNTGGMGSYSDANHSLPFLTEEEVSTAAVINQRVIKALQDECQMTYQGILYGGFIATAKGIYVIEFNARFGDPEALNVLSLLESDLVSICQALVNGNLSHSHVSFAHLATVCKYVVPQGYPDHPIRNEVIDYSEVVDKNSLYLAGVNAIDNKLLITGSRTAAFVGVANTLAKAESMAEKEIKRIKGPLFHREDVGTAQLIEKRISFMAQLKASCA